MMKKLLNFVLALTLAALAAPALTIAAAEGEETEVFQPQTAVMERQESLPQPVSVQASYDETATLQVCVQGEVREMTLRDYLTGVLAAEMPAGFPEEALKAQAVAARTYTLYKIALYQQPEQLPEEHRGAQLCDDPAHCEAFSDLSLQADVLWGERAALYQERIAGAVEATDGLILVYEDAPIAAVFCAASTSKTERAKDVWGADLPYLVSVDSPGGEDCSRYQGTVVMDQTAFAEGIKSLYPEANFSEPPGAWFRDSHRTEPGSVIDVEVGGVRISGSEVRKVAGLNSANFKVKVEGSDLLFTTIGYGHGVGMSQYGARYLALDGQTYDQILSHYYPGTQLRLEKNPA